MGNIGLIYKALYTLLKKKSILILQVIAAFLLPIKALIILVGFMIILDTVFGLWKAKKTKEPITSRKLSKVISKMVLYQVGLITFYVLEVFLLGEFVLLFTSITFFLTKVVAVFFCFIELTSINENIKAIYGLNLFQMFKHLVSRVKAVKDDITAIGPDDKKGVNL